MTGHTVKDFPFVEHLRAAVGRTAYTRLTDSELAHQDGSDRGIVQSLAIEGLHGRPEIAALFAMLREERVPPCRPAHGRAVRTRTVRARGSRGREHRRHRVVVARGGGADPYLHPGTDVLRNKLGIRDNQALFLAEYAFTRARGQDVPALAMTVKGYLAAHRHLFQDVYEWAGKVRTVTLAKGGSMFAFPHAVEPSLRSRSNSAKVAKMPNTRAFPPIPSRFRLVRCGAV